MKSEILKMLFADMESKIATMDDGQARAEDLAKYEDHYKFFHDHLENFTDAELANAIKAFFDDYVKLAVKREHVKRGDS